MIKKIKPSTTRIFQIEYGLFLLLMALRSTAGIYLNNIRCAPHATSVPTDPTNFYYYPLYINLHRCSGANTFVDPLKRRCRPIEAKIQEVETSVINLRTQQWQKLTVYNHTGCMYKCIKNKESCTKHERFKKESCSCDCIQKTTPDTCRPPFYWNRSSCRCICPRKHILCAHGKEFDQGRCKCVCSTYLRQQCPLGRFDENTCLCHQNRIMAQTQVVAKDRGVSMGMMVLIATIEFLVLCSIFLLIFYFFFCKYQDSHTYQLGIGKVLSVEQ